MDCLFCKIANGEIPAEIVYRDDLIVIFSDINPQAPIHKLIVPVEHIATLNDLHGESDDLVGHMVQSGAMLAKELGIAEDGYRVVFNCNAGAGQSVFHIHAHLLGGRRFNWPPG
jgi:histidine triad (HIT) family protein